MKPAEILEEIAYPLRDTTVLPAILAFALLSTLAGAAGLLGIWLAVLLLPALYRYLLQLLEARANGKSAPVAGIELFSIADNFWSLTPLVIYAVAVWGGFLLAEQSVAAARLFVFAVLAVLPASLAVLAVTRSPFESLNPVAWWRLMRACGLDYVFVVMVPLLTALLTVVVVRNGLATYVSTALVYYALAYYQVFLLFTFTGAVLYANGVRFQIEIPDPLEAGAESVEEALDKERENVLNHAYGFVSRGNRAGGLAHVESAIRQDADRSGAWRWYFDRMLAWESRDAALELAQRYLGWLLAEQRDIEALKLMTRCLAENPAFRPLPGDCEAAAATARRFKRDDLLKNIAAEL